MIVQATCISKSSALRDDEGIFKPEKDPNYDREAEQKERGQSICRPFHVENQFLFLFQLIMVLTENTIFSPQRPKAINFSLP
jgi:hypothetical protein